MNFTKATNSANWKRCSNHIIPKKRTAPLLSATLFLVGLILFFSACSSSREVASKNSQQILSTENSRMNQAAADTLAKWGLSPEERLPKEPQVKIGKLDNGLTYYIRQNKKPEDRAELRLVVNAGSILEDDDQQGLAHFTEHMAFNGTENFQKQALVDYLESIGMKFGPDLNAYTSFDETVYKLQVPTDSIPTLQTAFEILRDWAGRLSFDNQEVDKERGVIVEEWRLGRGAGARIRDKQFPVLFKGSRYAERLPIGKMDIVENFPHDAVKRFYRDWYRPGLMAVVAVGDFDPVQIEGFIKKQFSDLQSPPDPRQRKIYAVPDNDSTLFAIAGDPEASSSSIAVVYKMAKEPEGTADAYRRGLVESLYNGMFNERLRELTQNPDPPFIFASSGKGSFVRSKDFYTLQATVSESGFSRGLESLLTEAKRVREYGFTQPEMERQKKEILRRMEKYYNERDKTQSNVYVSEYTRNYLENESIPGIEMEYRLTKGLLPTIRLDEINRLAAQWITDKNRVVLASGPEKETAPMPTRQQLMAVFDSVSRGQIAPYREEVSDEPLVSKLPQPGTITGETSDSSLGITRLTLSNGVKVVLKPTNFKNDEILFTAFSPGGISLVPDSLYIPGYFASSIINQSGIADFGPIELDKKLSGKLVRVSPFLTDLYEGLNGSAVPADAETMFQLIYLYFTEPRADSVAYLSFKKRMGDYLLNAKADPEAAFRDTINVTMSQHHYREQPITTKTLDKMDMVKSFNIYRNRFAEAGDFTFFFVGNFEIPEMKQMAEKYLAVLPTIHRQENWKDEGIRKPKGVIQKEVRRGIEQKSQVEIIFSGPFDWTLQNRQRLQALQNVMKIRLREVLREDKGGTYGVSISASPQHYPVQSYRIDIGFGCNPERVEELTQSVFNQIDSLKAFGADEKYIVKVKEQGIRQHEKSLKENRYWLSALQYYDMNNENPQTILEQPDKFLDSLTTGMIRDAARQYFNEKNYVRVVLKPEEEKSE